MNKAYQNWVETINFQMDFYARSCRHKRLDNDFDWGWHYGRMGWKEVIYPCIRPLMDLIKRKGNLPHTKQWFNQNAESIWQARMKFGDDMSRILIDSYLLLAVCGYEKYYYQRYDYDQLLSIISRKEFTGDLPKDYIGLPLHLYRININDIDVDVNLITSRLEIDLINNYKQYFIKRNECHFIPRKNDVIFDCGSCIADISLIFAAFAGASGKVHLFDPVPLHNKYAREQIHNNPILQDVVVINEVAVGSKTGTHQGSIKDVSIISPGGCSVDCYETTSLDDYVENNTIARVDYIKMDIEGFESEALEGARHTLKNFKPRLAISCYHKDYDLWKIPELILKINSDYRIYFEHHCPTNFEAVCYAR